MQHLHNPHHNIRHAQHHQYKTQHRAHNNLIHVINHPYYGADDDIANYQQKVPEGDGFEFLTTCVVDQHPADDDGVDQDETPLEDSSDSGDKEKRRVEGIEGEENVEGGDDGGEVVEGESLVVYFSSLFVDSD